jgi:UDP-N-acetylmuramate dehydrogenase
MKLNKHFSLQKNNSFNVKSTSPIVYLLETHDDLALLPDLSLNPFYILGDGSNTLFVESLAPIIIKPNFQGIDITETDDSFVVNVGAGENWHDLVCLCISKGVNGLENLALIPGSVGAAPVQNIGAYGVEFSDFCFQVKWFEFSSQKIITLSKNDCDFSYRHSTFKEALHNKGIITDVVLNFPKKWRANLSYAGLNELEENASATMIMEKVINLRQAKLPDPKQLPNAGSFFKNPIVDVGKLDNLKSIFPKVPYYPQENGDIKLAAGWLIEQSGLKGYCINGVGVHKYQALVLVNHDSENGKNIVALAQLVQQKVFEDFGVLLSPEVRMVAKEGEQKFADLPKGIQGK